MTTLAEVLSKHETQYQISCLTSRVEKSKLSLQSCAVIAVSAIGKLPPVL